MTPATLYQITFPGGKSYIGITRKSLAKRISTHISDANCGSPFAVHSAIRKYGRDVITIRALLIGEWDYLCEMEKRLIAGLGTLVPNGYNMSAGGEGRTCKTWRHTEETKAKISSANRGKRWKQSKPVSEEHKAKLRDAANRYWARERARLQTEATA